MLARVEQSHTEISLSCHITTSRTFMIVLPFNMAIIVHDSFVSISSKLCQTHTLLKKKKMFLDFLKKKKERKRKQVFFTLNTLLVYLFDTSNFYPFVSGKCPALSYYFCWYFRKFKYIHTFWIQRKRLHFEVKQDKIQK